MLCFDLLASFKLLCYNIRNFDLVGFTRLKLPILVLGLVACFPLVWFDCFFLLCFVMLCFLVCFTLLCLLCFALLSCFALLCNDMRYLACLVSLGPALFALLFFACLVYFAVQRYTILDLVSFTWPSLDFR